MIGIDMKMPKVCSECLIAMSLRGTDVFYCPAIRQQITCEGHGKNRHPDCPLRPLDDNEIRVGDEVRHYGDVGVVTYVWEDGDVDVVMMNGRVATWGEEDVERTGRHFDDVVMMLKKMRGEEDD